MATTPRKSLVARAGAAARKVVSRGPASSPAAEEQPPAPRVGPKKASAQKAPPSKSTAQKSTAKKSTAKPSTAKPSTAKKGTAKKVSASKSTAKKAAAKPSTAKKGTAKKTISGNATKAAKAPGRKATAKKGASHTATAAASSLAVLEQESPWTAEELASVRQQLEDDVTRLSGELAVAENDLAGMIEDSNDGAGNDQADVGSMSFERDQEMVVVHNAREMLVQSQHALERIDEGTYGKCESCGNAIGKNRLMAFPRATLCLACKQLEERR